jgi:transposase
MPSGGPRPKYHESVRKAVEDLLGAGAQSSEIEQSLRVSQPWVSELRKLIQTFGTATPTHPSVQGRSRKIHTEAEEGILDFLDDNPTAYLDEIQDFLLTEYQITASVPTVSRCVKKLKLTHKKTTRTNTAQDDALRARYFARIAGVPANRIIVVDESAANERTVDRRWGWWRDARSGGLNQKRQRTSNDFTIGSLHQELVNGKGSPDLHPPGTARTFFGPEGRGC